MFNRLEIEVTKKCNLRCSHCSTEAGPNAPESRLELKNWQSTIEKFANLGGKELVITGGEPLLYENIFKLIDSAKSENLKVKLYTCGHPISKNISNRLSKIDSAYISLEGTKNTHEKITRVEGSYERTINGIKLLKKKDINFKIHFTPMKPNYEEFSEIAKKAEDYNAKSIKIMKFAPEGRGKDNEESLALSEKDHKKFLNILNKVDRESNIEINRGAFSSCNPKCSVDNKLAITYNGYALPCLGLRNQLWISPGNIRQKSLKAICKEMDSITEKGNCICESLRA